MNKNLIILIIILSILTAPVAVIASGTVAADFLNISVSAYQASVGGACNALSNGIASSYFNPAGLSFVEQSGVNLMHHIWYQDISYEFLSAAVSVNSRSTIGFSASYLHIGEIETFNELNQHQGSVSPYSLAGIVSYSHSVNDFLSLGVSGKYIMEKLADIEATGYAVDIGAQCVYSVFKFGLVANNLGPKMKYEIESFSLPSSISFGAAFDHERLPVTVMVGAKAPFEGKASFSTGLDYHLTNFLSLRSGLNGLGTDNVSNTTNFGAGINLMGSHIDYAFNPKGQFGNTHFFSFTYFFGPVRDTGFKKPASSNLNIEATASSGNDKIIQLHDNTTKPPIYIVDAGVFSDEQSALQRVDIMKQFGLKSDTEIQADGKYRVVLVKTANLKKAENIQNTAQSKGFECKLGSE